VSYKYQRFPFNLRPTTRPHVTEMAATPFEPPQPKTHAARKLHCSKCYRSGIIADRSFTLQEYGFSRFFVPVTLTLTLTRWPSYTNLTRILWRCRPTGWAKIKYSTSKLLKVILWQTNRQDRNYITRRFAGGQKLHTAPLRWWSIMINDLSSSASLPVSKLNLR